MPIILNSLDDTNKFAKNLVVHLTKGDVIELKGDLGAGKTTLLRIITGIFFQDGRK